jgi:dolichol-phosphate mannosyltransferase
MGVVYAILGKLMDGHAVPGWASSLAIISFQFGVLFLFLAILAEYVGRILDEVRERPRFIVSERLTSDKSIEGHPLLADTETKEQRIE